MNSPEVRRMFPGASKQVFLDAAGVSLASQQSIDAVTSFLGSVALDPAGTFHSDAAAQAKSEVAHLIGADPAYVAFTGATSTAMCLFADALSLTSGDNVVTDDLEFMSVASPLMDKCALTGAELRVAHNRGGRLELDDFAPLVDSRTRAVVVSSVEWVNGYRLDLAALSELCHSRGAYLAVDAIQQLGALQLKVSDLAIDFLACGGHKWMCAPFGIGFLYASPTFCQRERPSISYPPTAVPRSGDWISSWNDPGFDPFGAYPLYEDARRFEFGVHHAACAISGLGAAAKLFNDVGPQAIEQHVLDLGEYLIERLRSNDFRLETISERARRSGITTFHAGSVAAQDLALKDWLATRGIVVTVRFTSGVGGVRCSSHLFNTRDDLDRLVEGCVEWRQS